jgi:hypothetical protein
MTTLGATNYPAGHQITSSMVRTQNFKPKPGKAMGSYKKDHIVENSLPSMTDDNSAFNGSSILYNSNNMRGINNSYDSFGKIYPGRKERPFGVSMNIKNENCGNSYNLTNQININLGSTRKDTSPGRSSGSDLEIGVRGYGGWDQKSKREYLEDRLNRKYRGSGEKNGKEGKSRPNLKNRTGLIFGSSDSSVLQNQKHKTTYTKTGSKPQKSKPGSKARDEYSQDTIKDTSSEENDPNNDDASPDGDACDPSSIKNKFSPKGSAALLSDGNTENPLP